MGSQTGSQRPQIRAYIGRHPTTVYAGQLHIGQLRATLSDARSVPGGQGVAGSNPAVPAFFRMYVGSESAVCRSQWERTRPDHFRLAVPAGTVWHVRSPSAALRNAAHLPGGQVGHRASASPPRRGPWYLYVSRGSTKPQVPVQTANRPGWRNLGSVAHQAGPMCRTSTGARQRSARNRHECPAPLDARHTLMWLPPNTQAPHPESCSLLRL